MSNWIGDSGNTSSAGEWDAGVPNSTHDAIFNAGSFSTTGLTVTVDSALSCKDMDWTGSLFSPTLAHSATLNIYGAYTGIAAMAHTGTSATVYPNNGQTVNITWGTTLSCGTTFGSTSSSNRGNWTFIDALNIGSQSLTFRSGTLNTGNQSIACGAFTISGDYTKTLTMGSSIFDVSSFTNTATTPTINTNTAVISISGTGACALGSADYNGASFNLIGSAHTVSGSPTGIATFALPKGTTQTITITDGINVSAKTFILSGDSKHTHTITGTAAAGYTLTATGGGTVYMDYVNMSYCTATGATFLYGPHCTMTSCTGWKPAPRYARMMGRRF